MTENPKGNQTDNNFSYEHKTLEELGNPTMSPLAARIRMICFGEVEIITFKMLENVGITLEESKPAVKELLDKGLLRLVKGGFRAV